MENSTLYFKVLKLATDNRLCYDFTRYRTYYHVSLLFFRLCKALRSRSSFSGGLP